ncbi:unnamed protein product [Moneuplotes crassus]|uniref:Uncharacterized protein n=1 Tax=Euplotes crassus TaxID=5936 RepID=A0AAD1Y3T6_EUPCR|nr:unnamed protein product [Moneuplotes crassus]
MTSLHTKAKVRDGKKNNISANKLVHEGNLDSGLNNNENQEYGQFSISAHSSDPDNILNPKELFGLNQGIEDEQADEDQCSVNAEESKSESPHSHLGDILGNTLLDLPNQKHNYCQYNPIFKKQKNGKPNKKRKGNSPKISTKKKRMQNLKDKIMKLSKVKDVPVQKIMPAFLDFMSTVLWKLEQNPDLYNQLFDKKELGVICQSDPEENKDDEDPQLSDDNQEDCDSESVEDMSNKFQHSNVKYFEKLRNKSISARESQKEEKLSFKGKLGNSSKCGESVVNIPIDAAQALKDGHPTKCNKSIADNKSFSFKNLSNKNKVKNDEKDTIKDALDSKNSSQKLDIKIHEPMQEQIPEEYNYSKLGFSSMNLGIDNRQEEKEAENDKSLASFGQKIGNKSRPKSPSNNLLFPDSKSRGFRQAFDDCQNNLDDNSNNFEHKFLFGNESRRVNEENSMSMMFKNQHSNHYLAYHGTPNKAEISQQNMFDHGENSNISAIFPSVDHNDETNKRLTYKEIINENSQFGMNLLQQHNEGIEEQESVKQNDEIEEAHQNFQHFSRSFLHQDNLINNETVPEPDRKMTEDIRGPNNDSMKEECSLPHPNIFFNLKNGKNKIDLKPRKETGQKSINRQKKRNKKGSRKRKDKAENRCGMGSMLLFNDLGMGCFPMPINNPMFTQNNSAMVNPYFHLLADMSRKKKSKMTH